MTMTTLIDRTAILGLDPDVMGSGRYTARPIDIRGRGARENQSGRYEKQARSLVDDGWQSLEDVPGLKTSVVEEAAKQIITRNQSPDISFDRSINPYRGCEHGCSYCYARPTHAYMGLSPGLDFESKLFAKLNAAELLRQELSKPGYVPRTIALGANTDPYQPIERNYRITRQILEVLSEFGHPVGIVTKSNHTRWRSRPQDGAPRVYPCQAAGSLGNIGEGRHTDSGNDGPYYSRIERWRDRKNSQGRHCRRRKGGRLCSFAPASGGEGCFSGLAVVHIPRSGRKGDVTGTPNP